MNGYGSALGAMTIVISVLLLPFSGGFSAIGLVVACFLFDGQRTTDETVEAMQEQPEGRDATFLGGCVDVGLKLILVLFVIYFAAFVFLGGTL